jgi:hypothetical protein
MNRHSSLILKNLINSSYILNTSDYDNLKDLYKSDTPQFIAIIRKFSQSINEKDEILKFSRLFDNLEEEITDISPFIAKELNKLFIIAIENNLFNPLAKYSVLIENCGNPRFLDELKRLITRPDLDKFLSTLEVYKLKKAIYELSVKFNKKDRLVYRIEAEIADTDDVWVEDIDDM